MKILEAERLSIAFGGVRAIDSVNLAVESRYADVLAEHRQLLHDWVVKTNDKFIVPGHWRSRG